jgi:2-polyprenyl-3-methyl-5-hydroxy-6-metoxy-1,4-benzoquinol methylase
MAEETFAEMYARGFKPWDAGTPSRELLRVLDAGKLPGKTLLEMGCGTGTNAIELARRGYDVTAVDVVEQALDEAKEKGRRTNAAVSFRLADLLNDNLGGPYDALFDRGVYHHIRTVDHTKFQEVLRRVTHPGSVWLSLAGNAKEDCGDEGPPVVHEHEIRAELEPLFEIVELREFRFTTNRADFRPLAWSILMRRR